ncbi:hypothetical protein SAMN04488577_0450 [Bacillus sp. cl95]|nr:hypothetical protein [Bacillus sp. UNCCL13]SFA70970.1 hypothetical protein SAMN02799634_101165 [Bacillus sp. UNCCL13]SFQ61001.1 hypothetical protein SAMN04488577_0450 [Bacillus sp. cl95]
MGAWGAGIWDDDLSCDIQDEWNDLLDEGMNTRKATKIILQTWMEELGDLDEEERLIDESLIYIALAALQIRHNVLTRSIKKKALECIESGADLSLWQENQDESYADRKKVLEELKSKLESTWAKLF